MSADDSEMVDVSPFVEDHRDLSAGAVPKTSIGGGAVSDEVRVSNLSPSRSVGSIEGIDSMLSTQPDIPSHKSFEQSDFWEDYKRRVENGQDLLILVSDYENDRGTGKTVLSIDLAETLERTDEGFTPDKASLAPEELINGYTEHPQGSALLLDEAEAGVGKREAMSRINRMMSKIVSMGRVMQKYVVMNMPASTHIDKDILDLAHYWILVKRKGLARVYKLKKNPFASGSGSNSWYPKPVQELEWSDIPDSHDVYQSLTSEKMERLDTPSGDGSGGSAYLTQEEHEEKVEKRVSEARRELRDQIIAGMLRHPKFQFADISQGDIGDVTGMSQSHVSGINSDLGDYDDLL